MRLLASQIERKSSSSRPCQTSPIKEVVKKIVVASPDAKTAYENILSLRSTFEMKDLAAPTLFQLADKHMGDKDLGAVLLKLIGLVKDLDLSSKHIQDAFNFCGERNSEVKNYLNSNLPSDSKPYQPTTPDASAQSSSSNLDNSNPTLCTKNQETKYNTDNTNFSDPKDNFDTPALVVYKYDLLQSAGEILFSSPVFLATGISSKYLDYQLEQYSLASSDFFISNFNPDPVKTSNLSFDPIIPLKEEDKKEDEIEVQESIKKSISIQTPSINSQDIHNSRKKTTKTQTGQLIYTPPVNRFISSKLVFGGGKMKKPDKLDPLKELRNMKRPVQKDLDVRTVMGIGSSNQKSDQKSTKKSKEVAVYEKPAKPVVVAHPDRIKNAVIAFRAKYQIIVPPTLKEKALALIPKKDQNKVTVNQIQKQPDNSISKPISSNVLIVKQKENSSGMSIQMNATLTPTQRLLKKTEPPANVAKPQVSQSAEVKATEPKPITNTVAKPAGKKGPMRSERSRLLFSELASSEKKSKPKN